MGIFQHRAIIVTSMCEEKIIFAQNFALDKGLIATRILAAKSNGWLSFAVLPDGSKENWETSNECNRSRNELIEHMKELNDDGPGYLDWVGVSFGELGVGAVGRYGEAGQ